MRNRIPLSATIIVISKRKQNFHSLPTQRNKNAASYTYTKYEVLGTKRRKKSSPMLDFLTRDFVFCFRMSDRKFIRTVVLNVFLLLPFLIFTSMFPAFVCK